MAGKHEIQLENFKHTETVSNPVIILKGLIKNSTHCQDKIAQICVNSNLKYPLIENRFTALVELTEGENQLKIEYCCSNFNKVLTYKPIENSCTVLPLYVICEGHSGYFQAPENENNSPESACQRIQLGARLLQAALAEELSSNNFQRKTFRLEKCQVFRSQLDYREARKMDENQLWTSLGKELLNSELNNNGHRKFLAFLSCTKYDGEKFDRALANSKQLHDYVLGLTQAHVALGGGGLALFGSACLFTWPQEFPDVLASFQDTTLVDRSRFMDSSYHGTFGGCFSTTLGAVLHELCHCLDLGHVQQGIMGRDFGDVKAMFLPDIGAGKKRVFWTKSSLTILAYHRWLNNYETRESQLRFEAITKFVVSTAGLRVIELRLENGSVTENWVFPGRVLRYSFQVPEECFGGRDEKRILLVEDNFGNILKETLGMS